MKPQKSIVTLLYLCLTVHYASGAVILLDNFDVRSNGVFPTGTHGANVSSYTINGAAATGPAVSAPTLDLAFVYNNLDLDGDSTANDTVTFTLTATANAPATNARIFNQGIDTGFGNLDGITLTVTSVSGTTTDSGDTIVFDGFTQANAGAGFNGTIDSSVDINGISTVLMSADTGSFQFITSAANFPLTPSIVFDNSVVNGGGSLVARNYDLQFSTIPEPVSIGFFGFGLVTLLVAYRRRSMF